jgi:hypothetical protein
MPNQIVSDITPGTTEATDTLLGVKSGGDESLALLPYGADLAVLTAAAADKLPLAGGTVTGPLAIEEPTLDAQAATKLYVDTNTADKLPLAGGTVTGPLAVEEPTLDAHAATKLYVDTTAGASGALLKANDLSDLTDAAAARGNLSLGTAAELASSYFATAAQGATADAALQTVAVPGDITATGTPSAGTWLNGAGGWSTPAGGGNMLASANLSDVADTETAVANLGVGSARGTGVRTSYVAFAPVGGTTFDQPAFVGEIDSDEGFFKISYAGATGVTVGNLAASSTYVYVDNAGVLQQQTTIPTRQDWSRKIFTMRVAVDVDTSLILGFEYLNNPLGHYANSIRDLYEMLLAQGVPFKADQIITGRADLGFDVSAGTLLEFGGTGQIFDANIKPFDAVANAEYALMSRTAIVSSGDTDLVKFWDNAGTITALGSTTLVGHRLYRFSSGRFAMQYGQGNYANMALAKAGVASEEYVLNPLLKNATFFGWWIIESTATTTDGVTTAFVEYTIGISGGSSSGLSGALLTGNNLSDVLDAATARTNLGITDALSGGDGDVAAYQPLLYRKDQRNVTLTYTGDDLTGVVEKDGATTVKTTTLTYTAGKLTSVAEVADGDTVTTALTYTGDNLTSTTRTLT